MKLIRLLWLPLFGMLTTAQADVASVQAEINRLIPDIKIQSLTEMEETGLYEAVINGQIYYFTHDGRHMIQGNILSLKTRENLTELRKLDMKKAILAELDPESMIIFAPKKTDYMLTVFTDIDCGYCRQLHQEIKEYNKLGIGIRYMAYPRAGVESEAAEQLVEVWCAKDQHKAMTDAKAQRKVNSKLCSDNPIIAHFEIGQQLGVSGTPSMFLENGQMLPGYVPPQRLREVLDANAEELDSDNE